MSLVSCMAIIEGGVGLFINACKPDKAVLSAPQFHDSMLVAGFVYGMFRGCRIGCSCMGLEVVKFGRGCRYFRASSASFLEMYGNFCFRVSIFGCSVVIKEYISFCILSSKFFGVYVVLLVAELDWCLFYLGGLLFIGWSFR
jgi:hypothetical protein